MPPYRHTTIQSEDLTQADGPVEFTLEDAASYFVVSCIPVGISTGKVFFEAKSTEGSPYEHIIETLTLSQQSVNLSENSYTFAVECFINGIRATPTDVTGSYRIIIQQSEGR